MPAISKLRLDETPAAQAALHPSLARAALGMSHLALHGAGQITELAAEMHEAIASSPWPFSRRVPDPGRAPFPYRIVSGSFTGLADLLAQLALHLQPTDTEELESEAWLWFRAIINGVLGDKLARWNNPLALDMSLRDEQGQAIANENIAADAGREWVIIIHGLCMHDRGWMNPAHLTFVRQLRAQNKRIAWLRYNSGLPVGENGQALAMKLQACFSGTDHRLHLVGHSMGGLLMRSACYYESPRGEVGAHSWLNVLQSCSYLSTPHQGAPYERMGHLANSLLGFTPYTRPFMRLGNIRSAAIRDLRYGNILLHSRPGDWDPSQADHRSEVPQLTGLARHMLVGGGRDASSADSWKGDGLVPVYSALGEHQDDNRRLTGDHVARHRLDDLDHVAMLAEPRIYELVLNHLQASH